MTAEALVELTRGGQRESVHCGHAAVVAADGRVLEGWGDPDALILPRSSAKMIQALPLVETGAADAHGLTPEHLALACASHEGAAIHTGRVRRWLAVLGLGPAALGCGPQPPRDRDAARLATLTGAAPEAVHNNCSGKHAGFLTVSRQLGAGIEGYLALEHPVQAAVLDAWTETTGAAPEGYGIDGCSAPNHAARLSGLGAAMARFATAQGRSGARASAQARLVEAMIARPDLVAGEGRACTELMRAMQGRAAIKTGAEGVHVAILPGSGLGVALKIVDGATRAAEAAMAALLIRLGALDPGHPAALRRVDGPIRNRMGEVTGETRALIGGQAAISSAE